MLRRYLAFALLALTVALAGVCGTASAAPQASAAKVEAKVASAQKACKKATASAAKAKTTAQAKRRKTAMKRACKKARILSQAASATATAASAATTTAPDSGATTRAGGVPANDAPGSSYLVGVNANASGWGDPGQQLDRVAPSGANWIREEIVWSDIEPSEGNFDWSHFDKLYSDAAQRGMHILPLVDGMPSWAAPSWNWIPDDPSKYAAFVAKVSARYGLGGSFWTAHPSLNGGLASTYFELYNEPYIPYFAANGMNAARYANLAIAAADAGRAANPGTKYLASTGDMDGDGHNWTEDMFAARPDLADHVDGFAVHPYGPDLTNYGTDGADSFRRDMEMTQQSLAEHGAADKPIWVTEMGWSTCTGDSDCVSEQRQADLIRQLGQVLDTTYSGSVRALFLYHFTDPDSADSGVQGHFGLTYDNGDRKPAYSVLRDLAASHDG